MTDEVLVTGLVHLALIAALAALPQQVLLAPTRLQRGAMGLACGLASVLVALQGLPAYAEGVRHMHPTLVASAAFLLGPCAGVLAAAASLGSQWLADTPDWATGLGLACATTALGLAWRLARQRGHLAVWAAVAGLAFTLPPALLPWVNTDPGLAASLGDMLLHATPWRYVMGTIVLCGGAELLRSRAQSLRTLRQREEDLLRAIRASGGGRWEWDIRRRQFSYYGRFYRTFGMEGCPDDSELSPPYTVSDLDAGRRWHERCHPDDRARLRPYLRRVLDGHEEMHHAEFRLRDEQGRWRWLISRGRAVKRDAQGRVLLLAGMDLDVTEHYEMREAMRASEAKYTTVYQTLPDAAGITRLSDGAYLDINPAFERLLGRTRAETLSRTSLELGVWPHAGERDRLLEALRKQGEVRGLPMTAQRGGEDIPGLMSARTARIAEEDCLVFVFHDMTQEQRVRDELLAANSLLRQAGRMARLGVWEEMPGLGITYWSDVCFDIHGLSPGHPLPRDYLHEFVTPAWREAMGDAMRRCLRDHAVWNLEIEILRTDGRPIWVRVHGEPVVEAGRVVRIRGILQDIDEWRRALERLRSSEERLALIFKVMPYPLGFSRREDGVYLDVNPAWEQALGFTRDEALGNTVVGLGIYEAQARAKLLEAAVRQGQLVSYEVDLTTRSGEKRTVLQSMSPVDVNGEACWLFALHDITERKQAEQHVREREELLSLTIAAAALGLWDWDLHGGGITGDARWRAMNGLPEPVHGASPPVPWTSGIAPEDIDAVTQALQRHIAQQAAPFDVTCRILLPQGGNRWIRSLGKIVAHDANGRPARMVGMSIDVTSERTQEQQLERMAHYDALTGLPNRVLLERRLREAMEQCHPRGQQLGVAYLDLDGFKPVNDRLGHAAGDRLLVIVAERLKRSLRSCDCVARLGGDEFVILLPGLASPAECEQHLRMVMDGVSAPYTLDAERVLITASIGYTVYPEDGADTDTLLRHADQAMYAAKQAGRNRFHAFDAVQERALQAQREQSAQLAAALERGELRLYLQPKVDMRRGTVVGAEALARWHHPERGVLAPAQFLHLIEGHAELQALFGEWVVDTALAIVAGLMGQGLAVPVSINITPEHLRRSGFADWMASRLALRPGVPAYLLNMELTESAALYDMDHVAYELTRLRALGMSISFDDFGTGYSSLAYLRRLPMDHLKLDRSFVAGMTTDPGDRAIVQGVIGLARSFGYQIVAEGVETVEQGQMLLQMGCTLAQGYCIARPMPAEEFAAWAAAWHAPGAWREYA
ncbi:EAL domain-containing protein [Acidovorax sp. MR-S7]|uniref:sensor domain-containing protein n=1 Tax=Acidovorax sp. MR-S7 TaxID=1268622 RepID=UPI000365C349|nr:EAL domain-containing protein [Acidovorax sp. MR-S7]GAD21286.1 diguanylate cyclase/phosphodiesterase with PAS/PAC sensor [Acidovorax sp. MR-S7]